MEGLIFNIQRFSIQDGPGIRTTLFLKGCPMRCAWCSNPEGIAPNPEIMTFDKKCIGCGACVKACPLNAIRFDNKARVIDHALCDQCLECAGPCPSGAIAVSGLHKTVEQAFDVVVRDEAYYRTSGGGVTLSGGEPLAQWEFTRDFFTRCRKAGFHTALDTTGHAPWDHLAPVLEQTDLVLFDVKHMDPAKHEKGTGLSNERALSNLRKIAAGSTRLWIRIPLTPGFNDTDSNMKTTADLARELNAEKISLLPFHNFGKEKLARLGKKWTFGPAESLSKESEPVTRCKSILESQGLKVQVGA